MEMKKFFMAGIAACAIMFCSLLGGNTTVYADEATNISFSTASSLELNTKTSVFVTSDNHERYYNISLERAGILRFIGCDNEAAWRDRIYIYDEDMVEVASGDFYDSFNMAFYLNGGEYYVRMDIDTDFYFTATLDSLKETVAETQQENNNIANHATNITIGKKINGVMAVNDSVDYYKFTVNDNGLLDVIVTNDISENMNCTLYDSSMNALESNCMYRTDNRATFSKELTSGTYYIKVDCTGNGSYTVTTDFTKLNPKKPTLNSVKKKNSKSANVTWKKSKGAEGYQVEYSTDSHFRSAVVKASTKTNLTLSGLKKGETYYVRVRAYAKNGKEEDTYSAWSGVKTVKIK